MSRTHLTVFFGFQKIYILIASCIELWAADEICSTPRFIRVKATAEFSQATAPDALEFACFKTTDEAKVFFGHQELPFEMRMLREIDGQKCHLFYRPTIKGFRADPDNKPITELFFDVQSLRFLTKTEKVIGDPLDIVKHLLTEVKRPLEIHIGINKLHDEELYEAAKRFHFERSPHRIALRNSHTDADNWPQDYLKSGSTRGEKRILVPYRLYEGKPDYGELYRPLLDSFNEQPFVRSKLSWEGGDVQLVLDPEDLQKTILFHGHSASTYWGSGLSKDEYAYVLKLEFGAGQAVDLSDLATHVDYFLSFIPSGNIVLVSEPMRKNYAIARSAAERLLEFIGGRKPLPVELANLKSLLSSDHDLVSSPKLDQQLQKALKEVQENEEGWVSYKDSEDKELQQRLATYLKSKCGEDPRCVARLYSPPQGQSEIFRDDIDLLRDCNDAYLIARSNGSLFKSYVAILKSQFAHHDEQLREKVDEKIREIKDLGFRVVRVPQIGADNSIPWSGISYVNSLLVDNLLFLPKFGLGSAEDEIFERLQKQLALRCRVIPVYSRNSIVYNGGIHCRAGIVR